MRKTFKMYLGRVLILAVFMTFVFAGCAREDSSKGSAGAASSEPANEQTADVEKQEGTAYPLTVSDDLGNTIVVDEEPDSIISLSPACTEILFAVGAGELVKGRTDYCSYPEEALEVPSIGTYASPNLELIIEAEPQIVFASDYVDPSIREQLEAVGIQIFIFSANTVDAVKTDILNAGAIVNRNEKAQEIAADMDQQLAEILEKTTENAERKSVFVDLGAYYSAGEGSLIGEMLKMIGAENIAADSGETWPQLSVEAIIEKNPDVYLSLYTPVEELKMVSGLSELDCMKNDHIIYIEGLSPIADTIQRPGPRMVEGIRYLAEQIYPELF